MPHYVHKKNAIPLGVLLSSGMRCHGEKRDPLYSTSVVSSSSTCGGGGGGGGATTATSTTIITTSTSVLAGVPTFPLTSSGPSSSSLRSPSPSSLRMSKSDFPAVERFPSLRTQAVEPHIRPTTSTPVEEEVIAVVERHPDRNVKEVHHKQRRSTSSSSSSSSTRANHNKLNHHHCNNNHSHNSTSRKPSGQEDRGTSDSKKMKVRDPKSPHNLEDVLSSSTTTSSLPLGSSRAVGNEEHQKSRRTPSKERKTTKLLQPTCHHSHLPCDGEWKLQPLQAPIISFDEEVQRTAGGMNVLLQQSSLPPREGDGGKEKHYRRCQREAQQVHPEGEQKLLVKEKEGGKKRQKEKEDPPLTPLPPHDDVKLPPPSSSSFRLFSSSSLVERGRKEGGEGEKEERVEQDLQHGGSPAVKKVATSTACVSSPVLAPPPPPPPPGVVHIEASTLTVVKEACIHRSDEVADPVKAFGHFSSCEVEALTNPKKFVAERSSDLQLPKPPTTEKKEEGVCQESGDEEKKRGKMGDDHWWRRHPYQYHHQHSSSSPSSSCAASPLRTVKPSSRPPPPLLEEYLREEVERQQRTKRRRERKEETKKRRAQREELKKRKPHTNGGEEWVALPPMVDVEVLLGPSPGPDHHRHRESEDDDGNNRKEARGKDVGQEDEERNKWRSVGGTPSLQGCSASQEAETGCAPPPPPSFVFSSEVRLPSHHKEMAEEEENKRRRSRKQKREEKKKENKRRGKKKMEQREKIGNSIEQWMMETHVSEKEGMEEEAGNCFASEVAGEDANLLHHLHSCPPSSPLLCNDNLSPDDSSPSPYKNRDIMTPLHALLPSSSFSPLSPKKPLTSSDRRTTRGRRRRNESAQDNSDVIITTAAPPPHFSSARAPPHPSFKNTLGHPSPPPFSSSPSSLSSIFIRKRLQMIAGGYLGEDAGEHEAEV